MAWYLLGDKVRKVGAAIRTSYSENEPFIQHLNNHEATKDVVMFCGLPKRPMTCIVKKWNKKQNTMVMEVCYHERSDVTNSNPYFYADIECIYDDQLICNSKE